MSAIARRWSPMRRSGVAGTRNWYSLQLYSVAETTTFEPPYHSTRIRTDGSRSSCSITRTGRPSPSVWYELVTWREHATESSAGTRAITVRHIPVIAIFSMDTALGICQPPTSRTKVEQPTKYDIERDLADCQSRRTNQERL